MSDLTINKNLPQCMIDDFPENIDPANTGVIFELGAKWCASCQRFKMFLDTEEGKAAFSNYELRIVDLDERNDLLACFQDNKYLPENNVMIPAFLLFRNDGRFITSFFGHSAEDQIILQLDKVYKNAE